jgi:hypothetical protein
VILARKYRRVLTAAYRNSLSRVSEEEVVRDLRKRHIRDLDSHVDVVGHPAEHMDAMVEALNAFVQKALKGTPVAIVSKDVLAIIGSGDELRDRSRVVQSRPPSHRS